MSLGAYLGILCDTRFFKGTHREIHNTSITKGVLRTLITIVFFSPFLFLANARLTDSFISILFTVYILPALLGGFLFFAFSRLLFKRCKLVASDVSAGKAYGKMASELAYEENREPGRNLSDFSYDSEDDEDEDGEIAHSNGRPASCLENVTETNCNDSSFLSGGAHNDNSFD